MNRIREKHFVLLLTVFALTSFFYTGLAFGSEDDFFHQTSAHQKQTNARQKQKRDTKWTWRCKGCGAAYAHGVPCSTPGCRNNGKGGWR